MSAELKPGASRRWLKTGCVVLFIVACVLTGLITLFEIPFRLVFGWLSYLRTVLPQVQINLELILCSFAALAGGILGLQWLMPRVLPVRRWFWRWSLAWCAVLVILFATSIAAVGVVHQVAWLFRLPQWIEMRGMSDAMRSVSNARQMLLACKQYAAGHDGKLPETCRELFPAIIADERMCFAYVESYPLGEPWIYAGAGLTDADPGNLPVVWSPRPDRRGQRVLARLDGSATVIKEEQLQAELVLLREHWAQTQRALKP